MYNQEQSKRLSAVASAQRFKTKPGDLRQRMENQSVIKTKPGDLRQRMENNTAQVLCPVSAVSATAAPLLLTGTVLLVLVLHWICFSDVCLLGFMTAESLTQPIHFSYQKGVGKPNNIVSAK